MTKVEIQDLLMITTRRMAKVTRISVIQMVRMRLVRRMLILKWRTINSKRLR
jgi:hypothetical protein